MGVLADNVEVLAESPKSDLPGEIFLRTAGILVNKKGGGGGCVPVFKSDLDDCSKLWNSKL